jgi:hypothetical protein
MVQVKASKATLSLDDINNLLEFHGAFGEMDTELPGMLLSFPRDRNWLQDYHCGPFSGDLMVKL